MVEELDRIAVAAKNSVQSQTFPLMIIRVSAYILLIFIPKYFLMLKELQKATSRIIHLL